MSNTVGYFGRSNGGNINIMTGSLSVTNGAGLFADTLGGLGDAGSLNINARDTVSFDGVGSNGRSTGAYSRVSVIGIGSAGDLNITARSLSVSNGAQLNFNTNGYGNAGEVYINARDTVSFDGVGSNGRSSGIFGEVVRRALGNSGRISITTGSLSLTNGAQLNFTNNAGRGAAGNIEVAARSIRLDNKATLSSDTTAGQGNIILRSQDLVLRRGSKITTNATSTSTGGNTTINTGVIAALENSDISANASEGSGGRVRINAQGIFGTQFRNQPTSLSDITATSDLGPQFSGTVEINTPAIDTSLGLITLPAQLVDASRLIATGCAADGENEFIVTGRGGLPPSPSDTLSSDTVWTDLRPQTRQAENQTSSEEATQETNPATQQLVEAQGWVINDKGEVVLTAHAPNVTPSIPWLTPANCHTP